jgi:hypothetical protein
MARSAVSILPLFSAAARSRWKLGGSGSRLAATSNSQLKIRTGVVFDQRAQHWVTGELRDAEVKLKMVAVDGILEITIVAGRRSTAVKHRVHVLRHPLQRELFAGTGALRVQPGRLAIPTLHAPHAVADLAGVRQADACAHARPPFHQAIALLRPEAPRLPEANSDRAHAPACAGRARAQRDFAFQDSFANRIVGLFGQTDTLRGSGQHKNLELRVRI